MNGYIKLNRKFFDNFLWNEARNYSKAEAWLDLIQSARFEASTEIISGKVIELQRGELPASRRFLELRWGWGNTKVTNFLKTLTGLGMISQRQAKGQTILKLVNYGTYNDSQTSSKPPSKPVANQRQATNKPAANQNKESKESKEGKERIPPKSPKGETPESDWKKNFEVYLKELDEAYQKLIVDKHFIAEQEKFNPGVDVLLSMEKAYKTFWRTEAGWKNKKGKKTKTNDWKRTFSNAISLNKVYKPKITDVTNQKHYQHENGRVCDW